MSAEELTETEIAKSRWCLNKREDAELTECKVRAAREVIGR